MPETLLGEGGRAEKERRTLVSIFKPLQKEERTVALTGELKTCCGFQQNVIFPGPEGEKVPSMRCGCKDPAPSW